MELLALETKHRSVVYEMTPTEVLLVFAADRPCDGCPSSNVVVRRMLRMVYDALVLLVGQRNLRDWDASKLRAAISRQVEVVDTIVTQFHADPRFVFGRPVRDVVAYRQLDGIDIGKSGSLLQGAWLENGELVGEYFQPRGPKILDAKELLLLTVLGECVGRRESNFTHHVGRVHLAQTHTDVKVAIRNSSKGPLCTFIGIFSGKTEDDMALRELVRHSLSLGWVSVRTKCDNDRSSHDLGGQIAVVSIKSTRARGQYSIERASKHLDMVPPSPACRTLSYMNPSWEAVVKAEVAQQKLPIDTKQVSRNFWWRELCRFAVHRQHAATNAALSTDYKQEDEVREAAMFLM
ncbi:unnamed protein product [Phytophthora lilii]|uniref:Unnamed protein product n=1 Tax=Phytophthora lilii TaxID=2077276 RepID=A0A9W6TB83_9STRA|nr:unnamed protein product [Phytophthora lilii]